MKNVLTKMVSLFLMLTTMVGALEDGNASAAVDKLTTEAGGISSWLPLIFGIVVAGIILLIIANRVKKKE